MIINLSAAKAMRYAAALSELAAALEQGSPRTAIDAARQRVTRYAPAASFDDVQLTPCVLPSEVRGWI